MLLEFGLVIVICGIMQLAIIIMFRLFIPSFMVKDNFIYSLIANFICIFLSYCIYRYISYGKLIIFLKQKSSKIYFFSMNLLIYVIISKWIWGFKRHEFLSDSIIYLMIPLVFIIANLFLFDYEMKNNEIKRSLENYKKYSPVISQLLEDVRRRQHDFKNHLNTVYSLVLVSDEKNLKETILQYIDSLDISLENMEKVLQIDNTVVAAIIYNKMNEAAKNNIEFKYAIEGDCKLPFKNYELSEVLNNLLDNAFDAVLNSKNNLKKIFLNIGYLEENCIIEIGNTGERIEFNDIAKIFNAGYSTKEGKDRGYGLYNVKKIVESYEARIQLSFENNYTVFSIKLYN
ncbi:histidine kinase [Clostridium carboxidivorans P7]|uniref:Signal transduction histidine kinase regulating citrate/malate metabolism n=1 Tax=Clostridium carboxidivorans P7 TaxID=536227 RepID=C6PMP8_9CLOT|nr:GHKL domain-containing protein [Clostridium carboxidivorans]AKN34100.1 histidine kinase [Clostridium carboxidivorans P7]EET89447.1 signal transduction histidine kinase regulating citrate/malate metabolism [Clostridium carboxidivorans P7]